MVSGLGAMCISHTIVNGFKRESSSAGALERCLKDSRCREQPLLIHTYLLSLLVIKLSRRLNPCRSFCIVGAAVQSLGWTEGRSDLHMLVLYNLKRVASRKIPMEWCGTITCWVTPQLFRNQTLYWHEIQIVSVMVTVQLSEPCRIVVQAHTTAALTTPKVSVCNRTSHVRIF